MVESIRAARRAPFGDNPVVGERGTQTQRRILTAALDVFAEHGYHDSRIEQITEVAGCSRPTFYQYFSSKEDVFRALARHVKRAMVDMTERLGEVTPGADGHAPLVAWLEEFTDFYDEYSPVFSAFSSAVRDDAALVGGSAAASHEFGASLRHNLRIDSPGVDPEVMASMVVTMIVRANLLRATHRDLVARHRFVESLAALVHRVLLGPRAAVDDQSRSVRIPRRIRHAVLPERPADGDGDGLSAQGRQMRRRLLEAGAQVFPRRGYHETRIDDVVEAAGASHGSFYRYFENKEDLFGVLADEASSDLVGRLSGFPADGEPTALRTWLREWFALYGVHGPIIALWREMEFSDPGVEELTRRVADAALGRLMAVIEEHGVGDPLVGAMAFLGLVETIPHHVHGLGYMSEAAAIDALVAIVRRGFLGLDTDG